MLRFLYMRAIKASGARARSVPSGCRLHMCMHGWTLFVIAPSPDFNYSAPD
jgi:hypothetical protein